MRSFSPLVNEDGYLDENIIRRLKLPNHPKKLSEPLIEGEIKIAFYATLERTQERL